MAGTRKRFDGPAWLKARLAVLLILPVALLALPASFFDDGPPMCLSVILFDQECYGCGMTRACQHMIHGEFETAAGYNRMAFIVLPILIFGWGMEVRATYRKLAVAKAVGGSHEA
jgi:hypothetical protein